MARGRAAKIETNQLCIFCKLPVQPNKAIFTVNRGIPGGKVGLAHPEHTERKP